MTAPFEAFGHGLTVYWETVRVTSTNLTIQHLKYAPGGNTPLHVAAEKGLEALGVALVNPAPSTLNPTP